MPRPSYTQLEALVDFLELNPGVAKGRLQTSSAKAETKRKWCTVAAHLNSLGGVIKDGVGWAKYWAEKKCALKKLCAARNASIQRTGGGPGEILPPLSELDNRMVNVVGGQSFALGDAGLRVDPFPDSNMSQAQVTQSHPSPTLIQLDMEITDENRETLTISPVPSNIPQYLPHPTTSLPHPTTSLQHPSTSRPHPSTSQPPRRSRVQESSVGIKMARLAEIESRRVEAEMVTARAFANLSEMVERIAVAQESTARAQENMSNALTLLATAILDLSNKLPK